MTYNISLIAITPLPMKDFVETLGIMLGHHGNEFTVPVTTPEDSPVPTHMALHAWITPDYAKHWTGEAYPEGADPEAVDWVRSELIISMQESVEPVVHYHEVLQANGLQEIEAIEP